jgi:hypothetical protein
VSSQTTLRVAAGASQRGGRQQLLGRVYAVLRGVAGTQPYNNAKRSIAIRMIAQLGRPSLYMTLTCHELQPHLLLACAVAHLRSLEDSLSRADSDGVSHAAAEAVKVLMNKTNTWNDFTALTLCRAYPATVAREFMRMLRDVLRWLAPGADEEGAGADAGSDDEGCGEDEARKPSQPNDRRPRLPPHRGEVKPDRCVLWESAAAAAANADPADPSEEPPPFTVTDYVCRVEWQKRGMPHAHILFWCPEVERRLEQAARSEDGAQRRKPHNFGPDEEVSDHDGAPLPVSVPEIYDRFVFTTAPARWRSVYDNEVMADLSERTRHNHSAYCGYSRQGACRFAFPQPQMANARAKASKEMMASRSKNHFFARRRAEASFMGLYNPIILRRWRASMDLQVLQKRRVSDAMMLFNMVYQQTYVCGSLIRKLTFTSRNEFPRLFCFVQFVCVE